MKQGRQRKQLKVYCKKNKLKTKKNQENRLSIKDHSHNSNYKETKGKVQSINWMKHRKKQRKERKTPLKITHMKKPNTKVQSVYYKKILRHEETL